MTTTNTKRFWYLASPFSRYEQGRPAAWLAATENVALLLKHDVPTFSPVVHFHPISICGTLYDKPHEFWMGLCRPFVDVALGLIVLKLDGWDVSRGVLEEMDLFEAADKPILFMEPYKVPGGLVP